jgi:hypothetical protein
MIDSGISIDSMPEILRLRFVTVKRNSAYFVLPRVPEGPCVSPDARPHRWNRVVGKAELTNPVNSADESGTDLSSKGKERNSIPVLWQ